MRTLALLALVTLALVPSARGEFLLEHFRYDLAEDDPDYIDYSWTFSVPYDPSVPGPGPQPQHMFGLYAGFGTNLRIDTTEVGTRGVVTVRYGDGGTTGDLLAETTIEQDAPNHVRFRLPRYVPGYDLYRGFDLALLELGRFSDRIDNVYFGRDYPEPAAVVPEPGSLGLMGLGGVCALMARRFAGPVKVRRAG